MNKNIDYYMSLPYRIEIIPDAVEGGYTVCYPELPGCLTCVESLDEAVVNALDAKESWLSAALEEGIDIAEPMTHDELPIYVIQSNEPLTQNIYPRIGQLNDNFRVSNARKEGEIVGRINLLWDLVQDNILSLSGAAQRANLSVSDFQKQHKAIMAEHAASYSAD